MQPQIYVKNNIGNLSKPFFKTDTKNLFLNFQKFEKFKNVKVFPKSYRYIFLPSDSFQFRSNLCQNPRRASVVNH